MLKKVYDFAQHNKMFALKEKVVLGLSGGADSVCLLMILLEMAKEFDIEVVAVHLNHMIRGEEAKRDEDYCRRLCESLKVPLEIYCTDVVAMAKERGLTVEEAGRYARYEAFDRTAKKNGATKIAVAHHKNDRAETVLFNLFRGSGITGLSGIRPVNGNIVRPLLCVTREEIEEFLEKRNVTFVTDSTNNSNDYMRNKFRNELLPYVTEHINNDCINNINQTAQICMEAEDYLLKQAELAYEECISINAQEYIVKVTEFSRFHDIIQSYVLRKVFSDMYSSLKDISLLHIRNVQELKDMQVGKQVSLPGGYVAKRTYESIKIYKKIDKESQSELPTCVMNILAWTKEMQVPNEEYIKYFDYDKIENRLCMRRRMSGDFLVIDKQGGKKKLKDYFIDKKIPKEERDNVPLLADGAHILWVVGYRISEAYKVTEETKRVMVVTINKNNQEDIQNGR